MPSGHTPEDQRLALSDVRVLLEFLGRQADSRLQSHFDDTRGFLAAPARKLASPPCDKYKHFLNRLESIGRRLNGTDADGHAASMGAEPEDEDGLSDTAFLLFSRDFLAAVAAPATVDSIRLTQAYVTARRRTSWWRLTHGLGLRRGATPEEGGENLVDASARRLASRVSRVELVAGYLTMITLLVSAYALSGQRVRDSQQAIIDNYDQIGREITTLAKEWPKTQPEAQPARFDMRTLSTACDPAHEPAGTTQAADTGATRLAEVMMQGQSDVVARSGAVASATDLQMEPGLSARRCALYWQLKRANENMVGASLHLVSWIEVPIVGLHLGDAFGIDTTFIQRTADVHTDWCAVLQFTPDSDGRHCRSALEDLIYRTPEVADSVLGCIALYVLPTLYGCLGAAAAALRTMRRKVDLSLVTGTDRGRLRQDLLLGALCGAIMGLFVGYLGKGTAATGLGLSALALLAGYNVSGTFAFLDELFNRIFRLP